MVVFIGSVALKIHVDPISWIRKMGVDTDIICTYEEMEWVYGTIAKIIFPINKGKKYFIRRQDNGVIEVEIAWPNSTAKQFFDLVENDPATTATWGGVVPSLDALYTLKMSHRYLKNSPHFLKTMRDIQLMRKHGARISDYWKEFYKARREETYWYNHPKLKEAQKASFFTDNVPYKYDHDDIHKAVAVDYRVPAYTKYMKDGAQVDCDKAKFFALPESVRIDGVLEEAYVLALERHQIPNDFKPIPHKSFQIALMKVCTSITSGWFREFAWENYDKIMYRHISEEGQGVYVSRFLSALAFNRVKPYEKNTDAKSPETSAQANPDN